MARIVITRPNGETECAELTTNKAQVGNDCLTVEKAGTVYYAKLDNGVSTYMFVIKPDGRKLYVQKTMATSVTFEYTEENNDDPEEFKFILINPKPQTISGVTLDTMEKVLGESNTHIVLYLIEPWTGTIHMEFEGLNATFTYNYSFVSGCDVGRDGIETIKKYAKNTPFKLIVSPG